MVAVLGLISHTQRKHILQHQANIWAKEGGMEVEGIEMIAEGEMTTTDTIEEGIDTTDTKAEEGIGTKAEEGTDTKAEEGIDTIEEEIEEEIDMTDTKEEDLPRDNQICLVHCV